MFIVACLRIGEHSLGYDFEQVGRKGKLNYVCWVMVTIVIDLWQQMLIQKTRKERKGVYEKKKKKNKRKKNQK